MKVIPQYKVIGLYDYDRIIHVIKKKIMLRDKIEVTVKWKDAFSLKKLCNWLIKYKSFPNTLNILSILPCSYLYCSW